MKAVDVGADDRGPTVAAECSSRRRCTIPARSRSATRDGLRWSVTLDERPAAERRPGMVLGRRHRVRRDRGGRQHRVGDHRRPRAAASGGVFHLLDLTPEPDPDDPDLERFATDKDGLKADLVERHARRAASGRRR